jgi:hypothetical protein
MKHKHVDVIRNGYTYKPISTMHRAVDAYERLFKRHKAVGLAKPDDYVFLPTYLYDGADDKDGAKDKKARDDALIQIQRQFAVVMEAAGLGDGPNEERRTLYSLRHTCIMYRLIYGNGMDLLTLATNARTSVD